MEAILKILYYCICGIMALFILYRVYEITVINIMGCDSCWYIEMTDAEPDLERYRYY